MNGHLPSECMHDLVEGLLSDREASEARAHLDGCRACRDSYAQLANLVTALGEAPREATPPDALWLNIEERIRQGMPGSGGTEADALSLPGARHPPRRLTFTVPQLAAAAILVALLSAGAMWAALARPGTSASDLAVVNANTLGPAARMAVAGTASYDQAVLELERIVDGGGPYLALETLTTIDRSLQTIDDALSNIRAALAADPGNELLIRLLLRQRAFKLNVLRQAASVVRPRS